MKLTRWLRSTLPVLLILMLSASLLVQSGGRVDVNYSLVTENENAVLLEASFLVLDSAGQIVVEAPVEGAQVRLEDGTLFDAQLEQPGEQAYISLVLDASGSMANVMPQMRDAAIQAVSAAPDGATFSVIQFSRSVNVIQDFSQDRNAVTEKIGAIGPQQDGGTCIYDAMYRAIENLQAAPVGRRAIILFTDGEDITTAGTPCSTRSYDEVITLASDPATRIPVHTIGLATDADATNLNAEQLAEMATRTGGYAEIGQVDSLALLFQRIINSLANQWYLRANLYPEAGEHTATLLVRLEGGVTNEREIASFVASRTFIAPPGARVASLEYSTSGDVTFNLQLTSAEQIDQFGIQILSLGDNLLAPPFTADVSEALTLDNGNFNQGGEYEVNIIGLDAGGVELFRTLYKFRYNPQVEEGELRVESVAVDLDNRQAIVELALVNIEGVSEYEVWLVNTATNTVVPNTRVTLAPADSLTLDMGSVRNGEYDVHVQAKASDGRVLGEAISEGVVYRLGMVSRLGDTVRSAWWVILIAGVVFAGGAGMMFKIIVLDPARRKREENKLLLENTMMRRGSGAGNIDNWDEDAIALARQRFREEKARQERGKPATDPGRSAPTPQPMPKAQAPTPAPMPKVQAPTPAPMPKAPTPTPPPMQGGPAPDGATEILDDDLIGAAPALMRLVVQSSPDGSHNGQAVTLDHFPFTIGRSDCDLTIGVTGVSRTHAVIGLIGGQLVIRDNNSTNGTMVDGQPIAGRGDVPLSAGSEIGLGKSVTIRLMQ